MTDREEPRWRDTPVNRFIKIAPDSPTQQAVVPQEKNGRPTIVSIEYELLLGRPYHYTLPELKFATHVRHKQIPPADAEARRFQLREEFFAKPCACMRASPLTRQYGWGAHYDEQGRIAIYPVESEEYRRFVMDDGIRKFDALRSRKA